MAALLTESTGYAYSSTSVTRGGGRVGAGSKQHACEGFHCHDLAVGARQATRRQKKCAWTHFWQMMSSDF